MTNKTQQHQHLQTRKAPRQSRSRSTVDAIKQAAREMVATEGFSTSTTTLIAERAGVSIGSLYQYFPTREAIFLALYEDASAQMTATMKKVMVRILEQSLEKGVTEVMRQLLALHREHEQIVQKMVAQIPELKLATQPLSFENMIYHAIRTYVEHHNAALSSRDLDRRAFLLREIILGCIHRYLNDSPEKITDRALINDLTQVVTHYIRLTNDT